MMWNKEQELSIVRNNDVAALKEVLKVKALNEDAENELMDNGSIEMLTCYSKHYHLFGNGFRRFVAEGKQSLVNAYLKRVKLSETAELWLLDEDYPQALAI